MTQPYTVHGLSYKYDSALDFHVTMYDALPYKRDSDYCNAQKLTLHSKSMIKYYLYATKEDAYCIDNKDSHIKEILREIAAKQQKEQHSIPEVPDAPNEDSVTPEQIQSLLEDNVIDSTETLPDQTDFTASDENENGPDAPENTVNAFADVEDW